MEYAWYGSVFQCVDGSRNILKSATKLRFSRFARYLRAPN